MSKEKEAKELLRQKDEEITLKFIEMESKICAKNEELALLKYEMSGLKVDILQSKKITDFNDDVFHSKKTTGAIL